MTKKEMSELIDERVMELLKEEDRKFSHTTDASIESLRQISVCFMAELELLEKKYGVVCHNYSKNSLISYPSCLPEHKRLLAEHENTKAKIKEDAKILKNRIVLMGLKNPEIVKILSKYLNI